MEFFGRNTDDSSARRKTAGLDASSGGVSLRDSASAASTTIPITASRSRVLAKRYPIVCRAASAVRFQRSRWSASPRSRQRSIRGSRRRRGERRQRAIATANHWQRLSSPSSRLFPRNAPACSRHFGEVSERMDLLFGRVASVAWARSLMIVAREGCLPCFSTYAAMSRSFPRRCASTGMRTRRPGPVERKLCSSPDFGHDSPHEPPTQPKARVR